MKPFRFCYATRITLTEIGRHEGICANATFLLDRPLVLEPDDLIELRKGQWFLLPQGQEPSIPLNGRWDR